MDPSDRHVAARIDDVVNAVRNRLFRRRGWRPRIVAYTGYGSTRQVRVLARILLAPPDGPPEDIRTAEARQRATRGWRRFLTTPVPDAHVRVRADGRTHHLVGNRRGYVDAVIAAPAGAGFAPGWHDLPIEVDHGRPSELRVLIVGDGPTVGIVSDIDDTVMITHLPRPLLAAWNTFVLRESARVAVRGMADLYARLLADHPGAPVVYLSTGAWNVAPTLTRFLARHGFPDGPLLLTDWGPTNTGWVRSGRRHKEAALRQLAQDLPAVGWLLVGDDGQHDPEIYDGFAAERPDRVVGIAIRQLTAAQQALTTTPSVHRPAMAAVPVVAARDGHGLAAKLRAVGLLGRR
ncbi:App1 family protein [Nakamurella sp.]|uniref:App1 family protein n=1 Tax=Nakamurella sp. TaxID=1869182 RepID=UPI003784606F